MILPSTTARLDELAAMPNAAARGRALERYVANLFRQRHFTVILNSRVARPRQTDLLAVKVGERYLIECKWQQRRADVDAVDSLRSRLHRTSPDVIGVLLSMTGFTQEALANVKYQRQQPILLLSGDELRSIEAGLGSSLPDLLFRKAERLLRDAHVLLDEPRAVRNRGPHLPYPRPSRQFVSVDGSRSHVVECEGGFEPLAFTHRLEDIDWTSAGGAGVTLDFQLGLGDQSDLVNALTTLLDLGWVTDQGRWSIHQLTRNWHGLGIKALIDELPLWSQRAEHHSEEVFYVDRCDNGFYTLSANLSADRSRRVSWAEASFQLEGLPLDSTPLLHLCQSLGIHDNLRFRPRTEKSRNLLRLQELGIDDLAVRAYLVADDLFGLEDGRQWATGIVVDNPFYERTGPSGARRPPDGLAVLGDSELLLCDLRQHHPHDEPRTRYVLDRIEWAWTSDTIVCRPVADWPYP